MANDATFALRRARIRRMAVPIAFALAGVAGLALALRAAGDPLAGDGDRAAGLVALLAAAAALIGAAMVWRAARIAVVITRGEVLVRGVLTTRRVALADVAGFEVGHRNDFAWARTILRLTPGRHGIPRSIPVPAASPATGRDDWLNVVIFMAFPQMAARLDGAFGPGHAREAPAAVAGIIAAMNAELDRRRGAREQTADLLAAAHPKFRTILHDD